MAKRISASRARQSRMIRHRGAPGGSSWKPLLRLVLLFAIAGTALASVARSDASLDLEVRSESAEDDGALILTRDRFSVRVIPGPVTSDSGDFELATLVARLHWDSKYLGLATPDGCTSGNLKLGTGVLEQAPKNPPPSVSTTEPTCHRVPTFHDQENFDQDQNTDRYLELYWDTNWYPCKKEDESDCPTEIELSAGGDALFYLAFVPQYESRCAGPSGAGCTKKEIVLALEGTDTSIRTSGQIHGLWKPGRAVSHSLEISKPKVTFQAEAHQETGTLVAHKPRNTFGRKVKTTIGLQASMQRPPICGLKLRWFWNSNAFITPHCSVKPWLETGSSQPLAPLSGDTRKGLPNTDHFDWDRDPSTDKYCEATMQSADWGTGWDDYRDVAYLELQLGGDFIEAGVNSQVEYATLCRHRDEGGEWLESQPVKPPASLKIYRPTVASASLWAGLDAATKIKDSCLVGDENSCTPTVDVDWAFKGENFFPAPEIAILEVSYDPNKLENPNVTPGPGWVKARSTPGSDKEGKKTLELRLESAAADRFNCKKDETKTCTIKRDKREPGNLMTVEFEAKPTFVLGKTVVEIEGHFEACDDQLVSGGDCLGHGGPITIEPLRHPSVAIAAGQDAMYPLGAKLALVGPTDTQKHPRGPWFVGFRPENWRQSCGSDSENCPFAQLLELEGTITNLPKDNSNQPPPDPKPDYTTRQVTFSGLVRADIISSDGGSDQRYDLARGTFTIPASGSDAALVAQEAQSLLTHLAGGAATVGIEKIELRRAQDGGAGSLHLTGDLHAGHEWQHDGAGDPLTLVNGQHLVTIDETGLRPDNGLGGGKGPLSWPLTFAESPLLQVGLLGIELSGEKDLKLTYDKGEDKYTLTGTAKFHLVPGNDDWPTLTVTLGPQPKPPDFKEDACSIVEEIKGDRDTGIVFQHGKVSVVGSLVLNNSQKISFVKKDKEDSVKKDKEDSAKKDEEKSEDRQAFVLKELYFGLDTPNSSYAGCGRLCFPDEHDDKEGGEEGDEEGKCLVAGLGFLDGKFDSVVVGGENLNQEIADEVYLQDVDLGAQGLSPHGPEKAVFKGKVRFTFGPDLPFSLPDALGGGDEGDALGTAVASGTIDSEEIEVKGTAYVLSKLLRDEQAGVTVRWASPRCISLDMEENFLDGAVSTHDDLSVSLGSPWKLNAQADATVSVPHHIPIIGGKHLANGGMCIGFEESKTSTDFEAALWGEIKVLFWHKTVGIKFTPGFGVIGSKGTCPGGDACKVAADEPAMLADVAAEPVMPMDAATDPLPGLQQLPVQSSEPDGGKATYAFETPDDYDVIVGARWNEPVRPLSLTWTLVGPDGSTAADQSLLADGSNYENCVISRFSKGETEDCPCAVCLDTKTNTPTELLLGFKSDQAGIWKLTIDPYTKTQGGYYQEPVGGLTCHDPSHQSMGVCFAALGSSSPAVRD